MLEANSLPVQDEAKTGINVQYVFKKSLVTLLSKAGVSNDRVSYRYSNNYKQ